jgi:Ca2+-binding RTX toxin-like protein
LRTFLKESALSGPVGGWLAAISTRFAGGFRARRQTARPAHPPFRRKYLVEALEPRVLLSADLPIVPPPPPDPLPPEAPAVSAAFAAGGEAPPQFQFDGAAMAADFAASLVPAIAPDAPAPDSAAAPTEIAFVDWRVVGQDALTVQRDGMLVVVLDSNQDGVAQISEVLAQHHEIKAVHVLAHGDTGEMFLGNGVLDAQAVADGKVAGWAAALTKDGDILLYGCNVAEGDSGQTFVQQLAAATGADIGASTDATGNGAAGGNWQLEYTLGALETVPISPASITQLLTTFTDIGASNTNVDQSGPATSGNDIYQFKSGFFDSSDTINDAGGTDEIRIIDAATVIDTDFTNVSGVEKLVLGNFNNTVTLGAEAAQWAGSVGGTLLVDASATTGSNGTTLNASGFGASAAIDYTAGAGNDAVTGGAGDDVMRFVGSSWGTTNTFTGGGGTDTLDFSGVSSALIFELGAAGAVTVKSGSTTIATASGIERIVGGSINNSFKLLAGGSFGGSIEGNGALNTLDYSAYGASATVNLADADTLAGSVTGISGTVTDITNVTGSAFADTITDGGIGDTYQGGGDDDTYVFADDWGTDDVSDASGSNTLSFAGASAGVNVEFTDVTYDIVVTEGLNRLNVVGTFGEVEGSSGEDVFTAKLGVTVGADVLGGDGNDMFKVETGSDYAGTVDGQAGAEDALDYTARGGNVDPGSATPNFSGTITNVEKIQHPLTVPDGVSTISGLIQDGINATVGLIDIPLLGDIGSEATSFIDGIATGIVDGLTNALLVDYSDTRSTGTIVQDWLEDVLTFNFTTLIPGATLATVGLGEIDSTHMEFEFVLQGVIFEDVWDIDFGGAVPGLGLDIDAQLDVSLKYEVRLAFGVDYSTLSAPEFYFDTNGADDVDPADDDEITITLAAELENGDISDPQLIATLGFLQFELTSYDNSAQNSLEGGASPYRDSNLSNVSGSFAIDLKDPGADSANSSWADDDGRLTKTEIQDANFTLSENLSAKFAATADVDLFARLSADMVSAGLPSIQLYIHYNQTFAEAEIFFNGANQASFGGAPTVVIEDLALDLGSFLSDFINPILEQVQIVTGPLQPIVDLLQADIPILSDIDLLKNLLNKDGEAGVDIIDFMGTVLGGTKYASVVKAVNAIVELIDLVNSIPTEGNILIPFGTFTFGGDSNDLRGSGSQMALPSTTPDESAMRNKVNSSGASSDTKNFLEKIKRDPVGGGFSIPILTEPVEMLKLITGRTANLFFYDLPELNFDFNFRKSTPIVFPLNMILDAGFNVTVRLGFGYDSSGIQEFVNGGFTSPELIFKGFFIDDHGIEGTAGDLDEVEIHSHFSVGASVGVAGIVEAGVEGGVMGEIGFDLNDVDSNGPLAGGFDGKVYFHELDNLLNAGPECFIDIHGGLDWFLQAFVWVGLDLGFFGKITLYSETFDLGGGTIIEFEHHCDVTAFPDVADKVGADLVLHMGADADQRDDDDSAYTDTDGTQSETFDVQFVAAGGSLADFVFSGSSPPTIAAVDSYVVSYNGASEIFARSGITRILVSDAQGGNDVLTVGEGVTANLQFSGGGGNDKVTYLGTGTATINGQDGDDRLVVANGVGILDGGADNDTLTGGTLNDIIRGGDGNDKIKGGAGNDWIEGGMESVAITSGKANGDTIDGGDGDDVIYGGTASGGVNFGSPPAHSSGNSGSDTIKGGKGDDRIYGGDEDGTVALTSGKLLGDSIDGGDDNDTVFAGQGADVIKGGKGADILWGGDHNDAFTGGLGIDQIRGEAGDDSINWTAGDQVDSVIDGGTGNDTITVTGSAASTNVVMSRVPSTSNVLLAWGADNLTLAGVDKFALNAGTGLDNFTINDLAGSTAREVAMSLGATLTDVTRYDWDGDGAIEAVEGAAPRYLLDAEGLQIDSEPLTAGVQPVFDDYGVLSDIVRQTVFDGFADSVTIYSGTGADQFTGETRTDPNNAGSTVLNLSRTGTATVAFSIAQGDQARDTFLLSTDAGNDGIDLSAVVTKVFSSVTLDSGADNDIVFGTQFADTINSGAGNDKVSGNAGIDTFVDASGTDTLSEVNHRAPNNFYDPVTGALTSSSTSFSYFNLADADFTLDANTLTIAHAATEAENIAMFEEVSLVAASNPLTYVAGADTNTFTVQNWQKVARLDGGQGSDTYNITFAGSGSGRVTENDSIHIAGNVDRMFLYGTSGVDIFSFTANNDDWQVDDDGDGVVDAGDPTVNADLILTDGAVSLLHGPQVETVNYTHSERLEVRAGDGKDQIIVDDNALALYVYGESGDDSFQIGRVTSSHEDPPGSGIVIVDSITNGVSSESFFFGDFGEVLQSTGPHANDPRNPYIDPATGKTVEINVAQSGNDSFEVNHNKAPVWLFGNAGDDRFTVNAVLIDTGGTPANPNNVSGGTGTNTITYLQNAPVNIDGGSGNDIVVVNGTGIGDTFIVAVVLEDHDSDPLTPDIQRQKVVGAGLQINMKNVERLEVNGAGGDDRIHVFSTLPEIEVIINGGSGNDTIHVGGQAVSIVVDPPDFISDPPAYTFDAPPYLDHWDTVSWSWGDYWYFNWYFPFWHYQPLVTYTWWYPVWIDPAAVTIDPPPQTIDPPAFQFASGPRTELSGIQGKLRIEAGDLGNAPGEADDDRIVIHNQSGNVADTGTLTSGDHDNDHGAISADVGYLEGLGMTRPIYDTDGITIIGSTVGGIYYLGAENLDIHLNDNAAAGDDLTIAYTDPDTTTTVFAGQGADTIRVKAANGVVQLDGGAGADTFQVWSDANLLDGVAGTLRIVGGAGTDSVDVRDTADTTGDTGTLTSSALTGLDMGGSIQYGSFATQTFTYLYQFQTVTNPGPPAVINSVNNPQTFTLAYGPIENLTISLGSGDDVLDITGTQAVTTINANNGNDTVNVSSDGAALHGSLDAVNGALTLHFGAGNNTFNTSDFGDADADGAVTITSSTISGLAPALITYDTGSRFTGGVNIWAGRGNDVVSITSTLLADVTTLYTNDGDDSVTVANLTGGSNRLLAVHGDAGNDTLDASAITGSNVTVVLFGDSGQESYPGTDKTLLNLTGVTSIAIGAPGNDTLLAGAGPAILVGGGNNAGSAVNSGRDRLTGAGFDDVLIGDDGTATFNAAIVTGFGSLGTTGGDDQIDAGGGRNYVIGGVGADVITAGAGNDVLLGDNGTVAYTAGGVIVSVVSSDLTSGGGDTITAGEGNNVVVGGAAGDAIGAAGTGAGDDVLVGDNGTVTWDPATGFVTQFASLGTVGGDDTIVAGEGRNLVLGGVGADGITAGAGDDVVLGDNGIVDFTATGAIMSVTSTDPAAGGIDTITAGEGNNVVVGGAAGDVIGAPGTGAGDDVLVGDNATVTWNPATGFVTQFASLGTAGGDDVITAGEGRNLVLGGVGADSVTSGAGDDVVLGDNGIANFTAGGVITDVTSTHLSSGGIDTITAGEGNNVVVGGAASDTLSAGAGNDVLLGDNGTVTWNPANGVVTQFASLGTDGGDDAVTGGEGDNVAIGGAGADAITTGAGNDTVLGDNGRALYTSAGVITLFETTDPSAGGSDVITAGTGRNIVGAGHGGDTVTTLGGDDLIIGDNGRFTFAGGVLAEAVTTDVDSSTGGDDTLAAGDGNNVVLGGVGNDTITTGAGDDVIIGDNGVAQYDGAGALALVEVRDPLLAGNDTIDAGDGNDVVLGGSGGDTITGGAGNDVLLGDGGTATFAGGSLTMVVGDSGTGGADTIYGGGGNDILLGGFGNDTLEANLAEDIFTGDNARISFLNGQVTNIELVGKPDLVLQKLFELYSGGPQNETIVIAENEPEEEPAVVVAGGGDEPVSGPALPGSGSLVFSFGHGEPLARIPELLRNMVLELYLGSGETGPSHSGETGTPPADTPPGPTADSGEVTAGEETAPLTFDVTEGAIAFVQLPATAAPEQPVAAGLAALLGAQLIHQGAGGSRSGVLERAAFETANHRAIAARGIDW